VSKSRTSSSSRPAGERGGRPRGDLTRHTRAFPIVVSGPSGAGKTTLVGALVKKVPRLWRSVSFTTRAPRGGEVDGESYFFVGEGRFRRLMKGGLVEWAEVHGSLYGTPKRPVEAMLEKGFDVVLNIDVQGARKVKKCFPDAVMVFILPPSFEVLEQRIRRRAADLAHDIDTRLENARAELRALPEYDYVVVNDTLRDALAAIAAIVTSERSRRERYSKPFFEGFK
jgi:guanylate kinase